MNDNSLDKYLNIVNDEKEKIGLGEYTPLYPMLRIENNRLYIGILMTSKTASVWDSNCEILPDYWVLIDIENEIILKVNKTADNSFVANNVIPKKNIDREKEISKYTVQKMLQYENYIIDDIKNDELPIQKKLSSILGDEITIDGNKVKINEYLLSNFGEEIKEKVKDLVDFIVNSKYSRITFYYEMLYNEILDEYKANYNIDKDKIKLCMEIMNSYYSGIIGIDNFFNL